MVDYSKLYDRVADLHAVVPYRVGSYALPPLRTTIFVTYRCNLHCQMCFQRGFRSDETELSVEQCHDIIRQTPKYSLITFTGGEPLVRSDILALMEPALARNRCNMGTNGMLLNEELVDFFVRKGLVLMGISIDGTAAVHDGIRRRKGAYEKTVRALQLLKECKARRRSKFPLLDIKTTIQTQNVHCLSDVYRLAGEVGADFYTISAPFDGNQFHPQMKHDIAETVAAPSAGSGEALDLLLLKQQIESMRATPSQVRLRGYPDTILTSPERHYQDQFELHDYRACTLPWTQIFISPYGEMYPCLPYDVGNVKSGCLRKLWNDERMRTFRRRLRHAGLLPACSGCCYMRLRR